MKSFRKLQEGDSSLHYFLSPTRPATRTFKKHSLSEQCMSVVEAKLAKPSSQQNRAHELERTVQMQAK